MDLSALISIIIAIITFFSSFSGLFSSGQTYTVKVSAPEKSGYDWVCSIDDEKIIKLRSSEAVQGEAGEESKEFTLAAVAYSYGCARAAFSYTNGSSGSKSVYTFKVNGAPFAGQFSLMMKEDYAEGVGSAKTTAEILSTYTSVMNSAKANAASYTKTVYTDVDWTITAKDSGAVFKPGTNVLEDSGRLSGMTQFPIMYSSGCSLTDTGKIKAASYETLTDGNARITIKLYDEPQGERYIHKMFNVPDSAFFELPDLPVAGLEVKNPTCNYFDCTAVLTFNPSTNKIVSLEHIIGYGITGSVVYSGYECSIVGKPVDHERYDNFTF